MAHELPTDLDIHQYLKQHEHKELLRFLTCGSVDDGKSTLIGRLLYDSKMVYEDQLAAVKNASIKHGTTDTDFDPALLTDGLRAEREQGITIDVAYRYFSTTRRKFIIADTPGHEQYTRNMATGASTCDLAIILIDARHGVLTQTRRHSFIVSLLGIKHVIVAVNKMDLADWSEERYEEIKAQYSGFVAGLGIPDVRFVPMSALLGDNVVHTSGHMPWYGGGSMMHLLETVHIASDRNLQDFRFPVQYVNRPSLDFRGFCGTVASGVIKPGDAVMALPSRRRSTVARVVTYDGDVEEAFAPQAVTLTLADEIDISRGDMIVHVDNVPRVGSELDATVVWMADEPLTPGKSYIVKQTTNKAPAVISELRYRINVNTLQREEADQLALNEIGRCRISLAHPIVYDPYDDNRGTGAFIIIDRVTNGTVGAGMISAQSGADGGGVFDAYDTRATVDRIVRTSEVAADQRKARLGHGPATVWLTGPTGSGKRSLAYALEKRLFDRGVHAVVVDGYAARYGLNIDLERDDENAGENVRRVAEVARMFNAAGLVAICACLSPTATGRQWARAIITRDEGAPFIEAYLSAPHDLSADRAQDADPLEPAYESPESSDLTVPTHELSLDDSVERLLTALETAAF